eukprot:7311515-Pyramimonas_sp.AAC.1
MTRELLEGGVRHPSCAMEQLEAEIRRRVGARGRRGGCSGVWPLRRARGACVDATWRRRRRRGVEHREARVVHGQL